MILFPGLDPQGTLPSLTGYGAFLALATEGRTRSTWLLVNLALARHYYGVYCDLSQAAVKAEQRQEPACQQLLQYAAECKNLSWEQRN